MKAFSTKRVQVASSEVVRDINRKVILNLIRTRQPLSRADLARLSGLQRSTVSAIVEELIEQRWVMEGPVVRLPRGRRPTFLRLNDNRVIIGVDIRPLQITVALADVNGKFISQEVFPTPKRPDTAIAEVTQRIRGLLARRRGKKIEGLGMTVPGRIDPSTKHLVFAPNLRWPVCDLKTPIEESTGLEVEIENAANACVLAAVWFDHFEDLDLVVVTVSEGIGTGFLVNGHLARGAYGMAGEFGHVPLDLEGPPCGCGSRGCWEVYGSNSAALRYYSEEDAGCSKLSFQELVNLAEQGETKAVKALEKMAHFLGRGMRMIVAGVNPARILVVGELTRCWERIGPVIEAEVQAQVLPGGIAPKLTPVRDGGMARLRGTVALVLQKHFGTSIEIPG